MKVKTKLIIGVIFVVGSAFAAGRSFYCQHCGFKAGSIQSLTSGKCLRHPGGAFSGPHMLYEGSENDTYFCKYCGSKSGDLRSLTSGKCLRHPNGAFKGYHAPAL